MLDLPILNVQLKPCTLAPSRLTPTQQGHFCASCQRTVHDFTNGTQADLAAARAASPDGRMCGRFRGEQLAPSSRPPRLRPKLRRFLVALVLVCGLGLTSEEAWAQVRKAELNTRFEPNPELQLKTPEELSPLVLSGTQPLPLAPLGPWPRPESAMVFGMVVEPMPEFKGGPAALKAYIQQNLKYPGSTTVAGKVFVSFLVTKTGAIANAKVVKGVDPLLDAAALRVVRQMPAWKPARQNGKSSEVNYMLPITFSRE
jgi:protein TonB